MESTIQLIVSKMEELIQATGGKIEIFYPYVVKQIMTEGIICVGSLIMSIILCRVVLWLYKKYPNILDIMEGLLVFSVILIIICILLSICIGLPQLINPHYYAVKRILELGSGLLK